MLAKSMQYLSPIFFPKKPEITEEIKGNNKTYTACLLPTENGNYKDGDLSAILLDEFPFWVNYHRIPDINTALMGNWEEKNILIEKSIKPEKEENEKLKKIKNKLLSIR